MKKEIAIHFSFWIIYFLLLSLIRHYLDLSFWPFWLGGLIGVFLPDIDRLIYGRFVNPQGFVLQKDLIFHSVFFQVILLVLTFFVFSSSNSLVARGLTLSFCLHLLVDQLIDLKTLQNFDNWMSFLPFRFELKQAKIYVGVVFFLVCMLSVLM